MAYPTVIYGPEGEQFNTYARQTNPGDPGTGGPVARLGIHPLGTQMVMADGRKFRFVLVGGATLVIGDALTSGVATASQQGLTPAAGAVGDRIITLTTGAATAANVFAEGFAHCSVTPGGGDTYKIAGHALMTAGAGDIVRLAAGHALRTAITTTTRIDLIDNPHSRVIQAPATTVASCPVGVAVSAPTTLRGAWVQTRGCVGVLGSGTLIAGDHVSTGLGTAGAVGPIAAIATQPIYGYCMRAAASGAWSLIYLTLDG